MDLEAGLAPGFGAAARRGAAALLRPRVRLAAGSVAAPSRGAGTDAASAVSGAVSVSAAVSAASWAADGGVMPSACCMFTSRAWSCCSPANCCWSAAISALTRSCSLTLRSRSSVTWTLYCDASWVAGCVVLSDMLRLSSIRGREG